MTDYRGKRCTKRNKCVAGGIFKRGPRCQCCCLLRAFLHYYTGHCSNSQQNKQLQWILLLFVFSSPQGLDPSSRQSLSWCQLPSSCVPCSSSLPVCCLNRENCLKNLSSLATEALRWWASCFPWQRPEDTHSASLVIVQFILSNVCSSTLSCIIYSISGLFTDVMCSMTLTRQKPLDFWLRCEHMASRVRAPMCCSVLVSVPCSWVTIKPNLTHAPGQFQSLSTWAFLTHLSSLCSAGSGEHHDVVQPQHRMQRDGLWDRRADQVRWRWTHIWKAFYWF